MKIIVHKHYMTGRQRYLVVLDRSLASTAGSGRQSGIRGMRGGEALRPG